MQITTTLIAGTYHDGTGLGKVTYIGGHSFSTAVPYSSNFEGPYLRAFYNSLFFNGSAVAKLDLVYSPDDLPAERHTPAARRASSTPAPALPTNVNNVSITLSPGFTLRRDDRLGRPRRHGPDADVGESWRHRRRRRRR